MSQDNTNQKKCIINSIDMAVTFRGNNITNNPAENWKRNNHPYIRLSKQIIFTIDLVLFSSGEGCLAKIILWMEIRFSYSYKNKQMKTFKAFSP